MVQLAGVAFREAEVEDWRAIASLLGRAPAEALVLRQQVQRGYDPWFAFVGELEPGVPTRGNEIAGSSGTPIVGTVVGGVERSDPERASPASQDGRLLWLGVAETHRRQGIGSRLLDLAIEEFQRRQVRRVVLLVDGTQVEALARFRKAGFETESQSLDLLLPSAAAAILAARHSSDPREAAIRPLALDDVPLLSGLLIQLGVERAATPHDALETLSPAQVEDWLQRAGTVAYAAWERGDPKTPLGIAWASRRQNDAQLRFIGVQEDVRRQGIGRVLIAALVEGASRSPDSDGGQDFARFRPLRAVLNRPASEQEFFRRLDFEAERVTHHMARTL